MSSQDVICSFEWREVALWVVCSFKPAGVANVFKFVDSALRVSKRYSSPVQTKAYNLSRLIFGPISQKKVAEKTLFLTSH